MLKGKRGFTLLEILIVMIITAITLPVVGTVFYMLLSVPTKETGRLITINDVNLALNWIHEDVNRGQFFAGDPGMLMSINTVDFTSGVNASQQAWDKLGQPASPIGGGGGTECGCPSDCGNHSNISASDAYRWTTSRASSDGEFDTQLFKFTINASLINISEIQNIVVSWKGYGENDSQHATQLRIWNYSASLWEHFNVHEAVTYGMGSEGWLSGREALGTTNPVTNYIIGRQMYVLAQTSKHKASGCPYLYGWDGQDYKLIDAAITNSHLKRFEETSYDVTNRLVPKDGYYDLMLAGTLQYEWWINNLDLWVVDHEAGTDILVDTLGNIHTISKPQAVAAVDNYGRDVTDLLIAQGDLKVWESDLDGKDFEDDSQLFDYVTITLPDAGGAESAKLVVDVSANMLAAAVMDTFYHYLLGSPNADYVLDRVENNPEDMQWYDYNAMLAGMLRVQTWDGNEWVDRFDIPQINVMSGYLGRPIVTSIDLDSMVGNQIRLVSPIGMHQIDYVAVDYSPDEEVLVTVLEPAEAVLHLNRGLEREVTQDVLEQVGGDDESYAYFQQGDYINYKFNTAAGPAEGLQRSFVPTVSGYYYIVGPEEPEDKMYNLELWEQMLYEPNAISKYVLPRYTERVEDPAWIEWNDAHKAVEPPFTSSQTANSLVTNYIKVTLLTPGIAPTLSQEYMGQTYGGFYWVDRTNASNSISYTVHYYYAEASHQLVRQEWQDNQLTSTTSLAFNIVNFDDITFEYYPAGTKSVTDILPYLWVDIWATAGEGVNQVMAHGTSHLAVRGTTLSRGVAVLATEPTGSGKEAILISGTKLVVDGNMRSYGNITVTGDNNLITGEAEAAMYVLDDKGACANPVNSSFLGAVGWDMNVSDFVDDPNNPASNEYIWNGDVVLDTATTDMNGKNIWDNPPTNTTFKPGVYYSKTGNISLGKNGVSGMVTLVGKKVIVTSNDSYMSPFCNGVLLYGYGDSDDAVRFSGNGGAWSGSLFARDGGVTINGTMTQPFYLFGSVAAKRLNYSANSGKNFTIKY